MQVSLTNVIQVAYADNCVDYRITIEVLFLRCDMPSNIADAYKRTHTRAELITARKSRYYNNYGYFGGYFTSLRLQET